MRPLPLLVVTLLVSCVGVDAQNARIKVITVATLIDGTSRPPMQDAAIVISGSRISQVGVRASISVPAGASVIDGRGKFVIPGLADMHHPPAERQRACNKVFNSV